jgi:hypothetical protein
MGNHAPLQPTTRIERFLLFFSPVLLPLQDHIPNVGGFTIMWIMIAALAAYVLLNRPRSLAKTWPHPVFAAAAVLVCVASLVEFLHPNPSYSDIFSLGSMFAGAVFVASLCRDRQALRASIYGYIVAGLWLSVLLYTTSYAEISGASATNFLEASRVREEAISGNLLIANINAVAALIAQGTTAALAFALTARTRLRRYLHLGIALFCLIAAFLPMSRGGIIIAVLSCATVMHASGMNKGKMILIAAVLSATVLIAVPNAVWSRLTVSNTSTQVGKEDPRETVYAAAIEQLPKYIMIGVGAGNFWELWGFLNGFRYKSGTIGSHNSFFQVTIYWGLPGLLGVLAVIWQAYRCLPGQFRGDGLALCILGISVSLLMVLMVRHVLFAKEFTLGLGLLVGAHVWIWPIERFARTKRAKNFPIPSRRAL